MNGGAPNKFHGDVEHSILLAGVVDGDNIGMVEHARGAGLVLEAAEKLAAIKTVSVQPHGLESHGAADGWVVGLIDHTHSPTAQFADDFVSPYRLQRHGASSFFEPLPATPLVRLGERRRVSKK